MKKLLSVILPLLFSINFMAQKKDKPVPPPEPEPQIEEAPVFIDEAIEEEMPVFQDQSFDVEIQETPARSGQYYNNNGNYKTQKINDDFEWVYERYDRNSTGRKYGLLKRGQLFLPMAFIGNTYSSYNQTALILGLGRTFGLFNLMTEKWDIPIMYSSLKSLNNGLYAAQLGKNFGIIDADNKTIVDFQFNGIEQISGIENYYKVSSQSSYIRSYGIYSLTERKLVVPCKYNNIYKLDAENYFRVYDGVQWNIIDIKNQPRFKNWYKELTPVRGRKLYVVKLDGRMGIIDEDEKQIVPIEYKMIQNTPFNDGSYLAQNKDGKFGCITADGKVTLPFKYDNMDTNGYGNSAISIQDEKCGIVKFNNGVPFEIATCDYDDIAINNQVFLIEKGGKFGIMDTYGKMILPLSYDKIKPLDGKLFIAKKEKDHYLMDNTGNKLTPQPYRDIQPIANGDKKYYRNQFSYLKAKTKDGQYGIIDKFGSQVINPMFEDLGAEKNNNVIVKENGKYGLYNIIKKTSTLPAAYDQIIFDENTVYAMKKNEVFKISIGREVQVTKM
ncbi:MAG: WG repeat-containing protein [Bacteroidota bacterium]